MNECCYRRTSVAPRFSIAANLWPAGMTPNTNRMRITSNQRDDGEWAPVQVFLVKKLLDK